jgi:hypothetical protein
VRLGAGLRRMRKATLLLIPAAFVGALLLGGRPGAQEAGALRPAASFAGMQDERARSVALFTEAGKVLTHPRCMNCHPATSRPLQGDDRHAHIPKVEGGPAGLGVPGLACTGCHRERNLRLAGTTLGSVPGNPRWHLAPHEMAWEGKSLGQICRQLKDTDRNGGRSLAELHDHMAHDELVAWGWNPGAGREPAPGTQAELGDLIQVWIETGAECP